MSKTKMLIIPLDIISYLHQGGMYELLRANGFDTMEDMQVECDMRKFANVYTQKEE
jgi:hypothetical protein